MNQPPDPPFLPPGMTMPQLIANNGGVRQGSSARGLRPTPNPVQLLEAILPPEIPSELIGVATVHIHVRDAALLLPPDNITDERLVAFVSWQTGSGGGHAGPIDCTRGAVVNAPGARSVDVRVQLISPLINGAYGGGTYSVDVEAVVHWGSSVSPKATYSTGDAFVLGPAATTIVRQPIPPHAYRAALLCDDPINIANVTMRFYQASTPPIQRAVYVRQSGDPSSMMPLVFGARFYDLTYPGGPVILAIPTFEIGV